MNKLNQIIGIVFDFFLPKSKIDKIADKETADTLSKKLLQAPLEVGRGTRPRLLTGQGRETENKSIYALFDYRDEVIKHMIWALKYRRNRKVAKVFGQILYDFLAEEFSDLSVYSDFNKPLLIPIPLFRKRQRKRGFNQTEILSKEIAIIGGDSFCALRADLLKKIKDTPNQTSLERQRRLKNVNGVFTVSNAREIKNRNIILLDDVTTTGATLNEARGVLLKAGAKSVVGVAVAH